MTDRRIPLKLAVLVGVLLAVGAPAVGDGSSIEGRWVLAEQTYGDGGANMVAPTDPSLYLEFIRNADGFRGVLWRGTDRVGARPWPALVVGRQGRTVTVDRWEVSPDEHGIRATYTVTPSATDDLLLRVVEEYSVREDGETLAGQVEVTFNRDGEAKGSYVLRRRFERQP